MTLQPVIFEQYPLEPFLLWMLSALCILIFSFTLLFCFRFYRLGLYLKFSLMGMLSFFWVVLSCYLLYHFSYSIILFMFVLAVNLILFLLTFYFLFEFKYDYFFVRKNISSSTNQPPSEIVAKNRRVIR